MNFIISIAVMLIQRVVNSDLWAELQRLVVNAENDLEYVGEKKRIWVLDQVMTNPELKEIVNSTTGWLIGLALEAVVASVKTRS